MHTRTAGVFALGGCRCSEQTEAVSDDKLSCVMEAGCASRIPSLLQMGLSAGAAVAVNPPQRMTAGGNDDGDVCSWEPPKGKAMAHPDGVASEGSSQDSPICAVWSGSSSVGVTGGKTEIGQVEG